MEFSQKDYSCAMYNVIKEIVASKGIYFKTVCQDCELGPNYFGNMKKGAEPQTEKLQKIADYLEVTPEELHQRCVEWLNRKDDAEPFNEFELELIRLFRSTTVDGRLQILTVAKQIASENQNT